MSASSERDRSTRVLDIKALARVEGEGALHVSAQDGRVDVRLEIFEPPRFFEAFLRGRDFREVPDITARICGICPVAYQMSSCQALEKALGVFGQLPPHVRALRNLLYCGEWIESHVLHMFLLHLPDFLGYESVITMARDHGPLVRRALRLKKHGNAIVALLGGRAVHPVGVAVGGFYSCPDARDVAALVAPTRALVDEMCDITMFLAEHVAFPALDRDYEFVALSPAHEYPMNGGPIVSSKGLRVEPEDFLAAFEEHQEPHSNALHAIVKGRGPYLVGPLARLNLDADRLHPRAIEMLERVCRTIDRGLPWKNNFLSLLARAVETVHALATAAEIMERYTPPAQPRVPVEPRLGVGSHATEAPRGVLWHHYGVNADGTIAHARIIPPTSQNQSSIEDDLRAYYPEVADCSDADAALRCEHVVRNYDPCISCSVHFLRLDRPPRA